MGSCCDGLVIESLEANNEPETPKITYGLPVVKKWIEANFILFFPQIGYPYIILLTYAIRGEEVVPAAAPLL